MADVMRRLALLVMLASVACSSTSHSGAGAETSAPDQLACRADTDCRAGPFVNPEQPCCDTGVHRSVFSADYLAWRARWTAAHCADVECPMMPPPAPSLPCALEGLCVAGRCADTCGVAAVP